MTINRMLKTLAAALAVAATMVYPPAAGADLDPHIPDPWHDYCPGSGIGAKIMLGICDGTPYADGTYWRVQGYANWVLGVTCVVGEGGELAPPPGGPGGCEGKPPPYIPTRRSEPPNS